MNSFPYGGLHPDGISNNYGVSLVPGSLNRAFSSCDQRNKDQLSLDSAPVDSSPGAGFELIARSAANGTIRCRGAELVGATFVVRAPVKPLANTRSLFAMQPSRGESPEIVNRVLRISQVAMTFTGANVVTTPDGTPDAPLPRMVYLITPEQAPMSSLCTSSSPKVEKTPIVLNTTGGSIPVLFDEGLASYAVIIPGALYRADATLIDESIVPQTGQAQAADRSHRWFNIACVSDGLGQTELSGLVTAPIEDKATAELRLPALHMFTAKYCDGISATTRGTPIGWHHGAQPQTRAYTHPRQKDINGDDVVEAKWGPGGALCVSHSRLWMFDKTVSLPMALIDSKKFSVVKYPMDEGFFLDQLCPGMRECDDSGDDSDAKTLISYAVDHIHTRAATASRSTCPTGAVRGPGATAVGASTGPTCVPSPGSAGPAGVTSTDPAGPPGGPSPSVR